MISADPAFERDGYNIFSDVVISYPTAVLGGEVKVKTVDGEVIYEVKPGTASGTRVRLRGKGMPTLRNPQTREIIILHLLLIFLQSLIMNRKKHLWNMIRHLQERNTNIQRRRASLNKCIKFL